MGFASAPSSFYINTNIENNYILQGYRKNNAVEIIEDRYYTWSVAVLNDNDAIVHMDCLDNQGLIGYIRDIIPSVNDDINIDDAKKIIDIFNKFASKNSSIPDDIILSRSKRLQSIFNEFSSTKDFIDQFSDILVSYIAKNQESESVVKLMSGVVEKYPSIVSNSDIFKNLEDEVDRLLQENEDLKERKENVEVSSQKSNQVVSNKDENLISEINKNIEILNNQKIAIKKDIEDLQQRRKELETGIDDIEIKLSNQTIAFKERIINHSVDTFVASKISMQETEWSNKKYVTDLTKNLDMINNSANYISIESDELINYIENAIKYERPDYSRNDILNLFICLTQSFFTVFSGKPGSGKTSICNIIAKSLGLNNIHLESSDGGKVTHSRYIPVSVERGWTSKRDFIGYYNPLSKTFNRTNKDMYDALITLDYEYRNNYLTLPYIVLLDEANLSPMEYYWADFMNICDNINDESIKNQINLGDNYVYNIETTTHTYIANSFIVHNCYMNNTPSVMTPDIVDKTFEKLPQLLKTFNCIDSNLIYFGGEPLLNFELIKYCHEKVKQSNLIKYDLIISNLLLLNDDIIDWIKKENVRISWSFDGLWNENNRVLVDGTSSLKLYKEKIDSIKRLTNACKIMISPQSLGTMVDNMHFMYDEMHIGTLDFSIVRDDIWNDNDIKRFENEIHEFADEYIKYIRCGYDISIGLFSLPILDILVSKKYGKRPFGCFAGNSGIAVMPNGDLYPCARFGSNKCYKYGNIYNFDSKNIYTVNDAVNINPLAIEKCKMCKLYYYCNTGCTYSQLHNGKEPLDTICKLYHIIYRESLRIYNTLHKYDNTYDERIMKMIEGID